MRYQRLDLNLLTALRTLLNERSVTRAAEILCVSQSAMSGILARLREYFDDALIVQRGRRMELTPLGEFLITKVSDLLLQIDATLGTKPDFSPETSRRRFTIVASDYAISVLLLQVLRDIHVVAPGLTVQFRQPMQTSFQELEAGEVDFLIAPEWFLTPGFSNARLFDDNYSAVADRRNADFGNTIDLEQYGAARHVAVETKGQPVFDTWFEKTHPGKRRIDVAIASFTMLPQLVVGTKRIATMHSRLAQQACELLPVRGIQLDFEYPPFVEMLQWHSYRDSDPGIVWLRDKLLEHAAALPPVPLG